MDSYVVRIFRRDPHAGPGRRAHDGIALAGMIEEADSGRRQSFHDIEELWAILSHQSAPGPDKTQSSDPTT